MSRDKLEAEKKPNNRIKKSLNILVSEYFKVYSDIPNTKYIWSASGL